jgi:hypothetical protein
MHALEVNEYMSDIYFANGIDTDEDSAKKSRDILSKKFKLFNPQSYQSVKDWKVSYNHTHGIGIDLYESMLQKIDEHWYTEYILDVSGLLDYSWKGLAKMVAKKVAKEKIKEQSKKYALKIAKKLVSKYGNIYRGKHFTEEEIAAIFELGFNKAIEEGTDAFLNIPEDEIKAQEAEDIKTQFTAYTNSIKDGHGVIVIAHSQGNLFTNLAYDMFENHWIPWKEDTAWMRTYFSAFAVASPANDVLGKSGPSMTFTNDIIQLVPDSMPAIEPNPTKYYYTNALGEKVEVPFSMKAHAFLTSYMATETTREKILSFIDEKIKEQKFRPSQWKIDKEFKKYTKEYRVTLKHIEKSSGLKTIEGVFPFNTKNGKLYPVNDSNEIVHYVKASEGGKEIQESWNGQDREKEFYKLKGTDPVEYIKGKQCKDMSGMIPGGLFNAQLRWNEPLVEMRMSNSLMSESVSGCGINAIGSGDLTLYSVYPGTYPINVTTSGYESLTDENISDTITLNIHAVTANKSDSFTVTKAYQYAHLGKNGHLADILITRPEPTEPPVVEAIPTIPVESTNTNTYGSVPYHTSKSNSSRSNYYSGHTTHIPTVQYDPPLCNESCGCLPCEYSILSYLNQAKLGPISGAKVILYKADEEDNPQRKILYEGTTSVSDQIDKAGVISLPIPYPEQKTLSPKEKALMDAIGDYDGDFILELSGGFDIDKNDDLVVDSTFTHLSGKLHLILDKKSLLNNDYKVNILTEIAYQLSKDLLGNNYDKKRVQERLDDIAKRVLIEKLYPVAEEPLGRNDLFYWIPAAHKNWLIKPYAQLAHIVDKVYKGEDIYDDAYRFVYEEIKQTAQQSRPEPILTSKWLQISEGIKGPVDIGNVALISEGKSSILSYQLSGDGSELFEIDQAGVVSLKEGKVLDFEKKKLYQMKLIAKNSDGESRPVTLVVVVKNIVDSPEDRSFEGGVFSEDAVSGEQVGFLHFDEGTSPIEKMVIGGEDADSFNISLDGNITLSDNAHFDYEKKNYAKITVQAFNAEGKSRVVPIIFTITDAVDIPIVKTLDTHLKEGALAGEVVGQMTILSNDPILDITLKGNGSENFNISKSGIVTVANGANIDYESIANYVLKVQARNIQGVSREGTLVIRIDDAEDIPVLENTTLHIPEFSPVGTVVGDVQIKTDGKFKIESFTLTGSGSENFTIDNRGKINLANDTLSYSDQQFFTLYATATNKEGSSLPVTVIIYIDTQRPILGVIDTYVYENSTAGTSIGKVPSTNNPLPIESVRLEGEGSENFTIDKNLNISVADGAVIDYESKTNYALRVYATNSAGESDAGSVYIRVIDRDDTIKIAGFATTIYEDLKYGDTIGMVKVVSTGGFVIDHYTLSGNGSENFEVSSSGIVTISNSATFNRIKHPNYHLLLTASDASGHKSNGVYLDISVIKSVNTPVALSQNITLDEDSAKAIELIATDKDGDPLTYTIVTPPANGVYKDGIYTPNANFNGTDKIVYKANDGKFDSDLATISITVNPVNDKPVVKSQKVTLDEDTRKEIQLIASDIDGDKLTTTIVALPLHGTYENGLYIPNANYFGTDKIVYKVNDGTIDSDLATISITINPVNDKPVAVSQDITLDEDTNSSIKLNATDVDGDKLTTTIVTPPLHGSYKNGVYIPKIDFNGIDRIVYKVNDGIIDSDLATISITVNSVNDKPYAYSQHIVIEDDMNKSIKLSATDIDEDTLTFRVIDQPLHGTYTKGVYTPNKNYYGDDSFTFVANDGKVDSNIATVSITILQKKKNACKLLPKTGQTISYAKYDDGYYKKGAEVEHRFDNRRYYGIIIDNVTGLSWQDDYFFSMKVKKSWQEAMDYCEELDLAGFTDWRLPTVDELVFIIDRGRSHNYPVTYSEFEHISKGFYWSSTDNWVEDFLFEKPKAWSIDLYSGSGANLNDKTDVNNVCCVRDGQ